MVDRQSATGCRNLDPHFTIQIDEDHSDMVKFNRDDFRASIFIEKIQEMCGPSKRLHELDPVVPKMDMGFDGRHDSDVSYREQDIPEDVRKSELTGWDYDCMHIKNSALLNHDSDQCSDHFLPQVTRKRPKI
jgi:hypothetical protein